MGTARSTAQAPRSGREHPRFCVATVPRGARRCARSSSRRESSCSARCRTVRSPSPATRGLELVVASDDIPEGESRARQARDGDGAVGGVSELPAAHAGGRRGCSRTSPPPTVTWTSRGVQIERFREATEPVAHLMRHVANSAAALRLPESRFDAARCGIALYGISPFGADAGDDGLEPVLSWQTEIAQARLLRAGESTGYGRPVRRRRGHLDRHRARRLRRRLSP